MPLFQQGSTQIILPVFISTIYIGETGRSFTESAKGHWNVHSTNIEDSHMVKHQVIEHGGRFCYESVGGGTNGHNGKAGSILNSKS